MTDMVEKVAMAICASDGECAIYCGLGKCGDPAMAMKYHEIAARAAIRALMEPTPRMISAGVACEPETAPLGELWQAMLKAALDD